MNITPHFTVDEVIFSDTALRLGIINSPPAEIEGAILRTAQGAEEVRELLGGFPMHINSWYRCPALNKAVGGAANSQHMAGEAIDFTCKAFGPPHAIVAHLAAHADLLGFDQLIEEFGSWVHVSFVSSNPRRQVLRFSN